MNAEEARKIVDEHMENPHTEALLDSVYKKIREAATRGKYSLTQPLSDQNVCFVSEEMEAVLKVLRQQGYTITYDPTPDTGPPDVSSQIEVSWWSPYTLSE